MRNLTMGQDGNSLSIFVPLAKVDDEKRMVYGYASTEAIDSDGERITRDAIAAALPGYMEFANIREMHQLSAVGVTKEAEMDDKGLWIGAKIVDDEAWKKVKEEVYKGFSIGGNATARDPVNRKTITGIELVEISVVDRPANPEALIEIYKAEKPLAAWSVSDYAKKLCREAGRDPGAILQKAMTPEGPVYNWQAFEAQAKTELEFLKTHMPKSVGVAAGNPKATATTDAAAAPVVAKTAEARPAGQEAEETAINVVGDTKPVQKTTVPDDVANPAVANTLTLTVDDAKAYLLQAIEALPPEELIKAAERAKAVSDGSSTDAGEVSKAKAADTAKADDKEEKPKGDYGSHADAGYADPGYQDDEKPRYPLKEDGEFSAERIRAAWNYISKEKNQKPYTAAQLKEIKNRIIAAWKKAIDKDGPPSADKDSKSKTMHIPEQEDTLKTEALNTFGKADAATSVKKGLYAVSGAISLLAQLNCLCENLEAEAAVEGDESPLPDRFKSVLQMMASLIQALLEEEVEEMLNSGVDVNSYVAYAEKMPALLKAFIGRTAFTDSLRKAVGDRTGDKGFAALSAFLDAIEKAGKMPAQTQEWGDRNSGDQDSNDSWDRDMVGKAQDMHDMCVKMGASCGDVAKAKAKAKDKEDDGDNNEDDRDPKDADKSKKAKTQKDEEMAAKDKEDDDDAEDKDKAKKKAAKSKEPSVAEAVADAMSPFVKAMTALAEKMVPAAAEPVNKQEQRRDPPMPALKVIDKDADGVGKAQGENDATKPADVLKAQMSKPNFISRA